MLKIKPFKVIWLELVGLTLITQVVLVLSNLFAKLINDRIYNYAEVVNSRNLIGNPFWEKAMEMTDWTFLILNVLFYGVLYGTIILYFLLKRWSAPMHTSLIMTGILLCITYILCEQLFYQSCRNESATRCDHT